MTEDEKVNIIIEALIREGMIKEVSLDEFTLTSYGMLEASRIILNDFKSQMWDQRQGPMDSLQEQLLLEEFAQRIANSKVGTLGYLVKHYRKMNA